MTKINLHLFTFSYTLIISTIQYTVPSKIQQGPADRSPLARVFTEFTEATNVIQTKICISTGNGYGIA